MRSELLHGDCLELLATLPAESIDACVTDPPYELGFMGKHWDASGVAFQVETWAAVARVLKPGAHLVAFGSTRTYHRMTAAIEDAGFEIRDSFLYWGYGVGFPKSLNVSNDERFCQCPKAPETRLDAAIVSGLRRRMDADKPIPSQPQQDVLMGVREAIDDGAEAASVQAAKHQLHGMRQTVSSSPQPSQARLSANVLQPMQREGQGDCLAPARAQGAQGLDGRERPLLPQEDERRAEPSVEGRGDVQAEQGQLHRPEICQVSVRVVGDGQEGRVRDGASAGRGAVGRTDVDAGGSRASRGPQHSKQRTSQSVAVADEPKPQDGRRWPACHRCGKSVVPSGLGTALKPAYEPAVLARKPFKGTVAQNVEQHGTGALNIDACRIDANGESTKRIINTDVGALGSAYQREHGYRPNWHKENAQIEGGSDLGRWPANVCLDDLAAMVLDEMTGELKTTGDYERSTVGARKAEGWGHSDPSRQVGYGDSGGGSRFFYVAKPSREERDMGCYGLRERSGGEATARTDGTAGLNNPRAGAGRTGGARNFHPTVKPVELMRWLVRLVTPINGTVIDPFLGSGTTGMAARYEMRNFIGIEREREYLDIAERRIASVCPLFSESA